MTSDRAARILTLLLRFLGVLTLTALVPMVMPTDWMVSTNDWLGLEPFHRAPLTEYLTRSLSAVYAVFGGLTLFVSRDVRRYVEFISFAAVLMVALGVFYTVLDFRAGMPASWAWTEGPPTVIVGIWMHRLAAGVRPASS